MERRERVSKIGVLKQKHEPEIFIFIHLNGSIILRQANDEAVIIEKEKLKEFISLLPVPEESKPTEAKRIHHMAPVINDAIVQKPEPAKPNYKVLYENAKKIIAQQNSSIWINSNAAKQVDSEREMNDILTKENERLRALLSEKQSPPLHPISKEDIHEMAKSYAEVRWINYDINEVGTEWRSSVRDYTAGIQKGLEISEKEMGLFFNSILNGGNVYGIGCDNGERFFIDEGGDEITFSALLSIWKEERN
jgi:hypothetical protein